MNWNHSKNFTARKTSTANRPLHLLLCNRMNPFWVFPDVNYYVNNHRLAVDSVAFIRVVWIFRNFAINMHCEDCFVWLFKLVALFTENYKSNIFVIGSFWLWSGLRFLAFTGNDVVYLRLPNTAENSLIVFCYSLGLLFRRSTIPKVH